ncbi:hypothetical protein O181_025612 [Austropuccinia psidii MF-1]|uniref:Uncharacterized protein n=1 Tax=Austropuccinia psidii MF-1 TaxID=1389203 RepID=A0A9Q3CNW9_9BASI|nr:hypothetical protein [Austropuccinia psidii MF-1]
MDLPPSSYHDSLEDLWDEKEEPEEIETMMNAFPYSYHHYFDVFSKLNAEKLPLHCACYHHIKLKGSLPPVGLIYSLSNQESDTLRAYISENSGKGFIWPSSSSTGEPVLFIKKERWWPPFVRLLPQTQCCHQEEQSASQISLCYAYSLLRIKEGYEHFTAFRTKYRIYEYLDMPFRLTNSHSPFQNIVNYAFSDLLDVYVVVYLNDIMAFYKY